MFELDNRIPIYICGHKNADYDSLCSSFALTLILKQVGKNAYMLIEEKDKQKLECFGHSECFSTEITEKKYNFIIVDTNRTARLHEPFENYYKNAKETFNIDHHNGNKTNADYIISVEDISATAEIIFNITEFQDIRLDKTIASLLYLGIISDTDLLSNRITIKTMETIVKLMKYEIDTKYMISNFYLSKTDMEMKAIAQMVNDLKYDTFHYIVLDMGSESYKNIAYIDICKKCIPIVLMNESIKVLGVYMKYGAKIKGEYRSKCDIDVSVLAEKLVGGGHKGASGFSNNKSVAEIIAITKDYIEETSN